MPVKISHQYCVILALIAGIQDRSAEVVRPLGKASIQPSFLTVEDSVPPVSLYHVGFLGPPDTQAEFNGEHVNITKIPESTQGDTFLYTAMIPGNHNNYYNWLTLTSSSTQEKLSLLFNYNFEERSQTNFIENHCQIGIEKLKRGILTEYKGTVKNCGEHDVIKEYFYVSLKNKTKDKVNIVSTYPEYPELEAIQEKYLRYVDTYRENGTDNFYAFLNYHAMKVDDVTLESLRFQLWVSEKNAFQEGSVAGMRQWQFDII